jgi:hypothetical protein
VVRIIVPAGWKSSDDVLVEAFKALGCERWGGASVNGWSKISDFLRCEYRYYLKHIKGLTCSSVLSDSSPALEIGSYGHAALAAHYAGLLPDDRYPGFRDNCPTPEALLVALDAAGAEPMALQEARTVWAGYTEHWGNDGWTPMAVEMPAGDDGLHTCRYDLIASVADDIHDGIWAVDHKLLSPKANPDLYALDGEILGEALCWQLSNLDGTFGPLAGVCINVLFKGKPPKGMQPYFRRWFPLDEELIRDFARNRMYWQARVNTCLKMDRFSKSHYGCVARYDTCLFWDHCATLDASRLISREKQP